MTMRMELVHRADIDESGNGGPHGQVVVKINAEVDEQVAPLVSALNEFDGTFTIDSCQGDARSMAYVYFTRSGATRDLLLFVDELAANLNARLTARENEYEIGVEWSAGTEKPLAVLRTRPDYIDILAAALFRAATTHKKPTPYGK
jgi:hypothetical protein